jgi:hypothetical protein
MSEKTLFSFLLPIVVITIILVVVLIFGQVFGRCEEIGSKLISTLMPALAQARDADATGCMTRDL